MKFKLKLKLPKFKKFTPTKRQIKLVLLSLAVLAGSAIYWAEYRKSPYKAEETTSEVKVVEVGGTVTLANQTQLPEILIFVDGNGIPTEADGSYLDRIIVPKNQMSAGVWFEDVRSKAYQISDGREAQIWLTDDYVRQDFTIEPVP